MAPLPVFGGARAGMRSVLAPALRKSRLPVAGPELGQQRAGAGRRAGSGSIADTTATEVSQSRTNAAAEEPWLGSSSAACNRPTIMPERIAKAPPGQQSRFPIENMKRNNEIVNVICFQADG